MTINAHNKALQSLAKNMTRREAESLLDSLRWKADQQIVNHFGERVWLKPLLAPDGRRIGITDCCFVDDPCERHKAIAETPDNRTRPADEGPCGYIPGALMEAD